MGDNRCVECGLRGALDLACYLPTEGWRSGILCCGPCSLKLAHSNAVGGITFTDRFHDLNGTRPPNAILLKAAGPVCFEDRLRRAHIALFGSLKDVSTHGTP